MPLLVYLIKSGICASQVPDLFFLLGELIIQVGELTKQEGDLSAVGKNIKSGPDEGWGSMP